VKSINKQLTFPPRFGEQNEYIYTQTLGYTKEQLEEYKTKGII
jgi:hypothetical protein